MNRRYWNLLIRRTELSPDEVVERLERILLSEITLTHNIGTGPTTRLGEMPRRKKRKKKFDRNQVEPQE